jgi:hypothetical protein
MCYVSATTRRVNEKNRANSWSDCHSRVEVPRHSTVDSKRRTQKKMCWDSVHALLLELAVRLQAGEDREDRALLLLRRAANSKAD